MLRERKLSIDNNVWQKESNQTVYATNGGYDCHEADSLPSLSQKLLRRKDLLFIENVSIHDSLCIYQILVSSINCKIFSFTTKYFLNLSIDNLVIEWNFLSGNFCVACLVISIGQVIDLRHRRSVVHLTILNKLVNIELFKQGFCSYLDVL